MIAFHCTNRAAGASVCVPLLVYGLNHLDHSLPGSSVFPVRTKISSRGSLLFADPFESVVPGLHHSTRPHCENNCVSNDRDSYVPSGSYSGPSAINFPGFAVDRKILPLLLRTIPVICAEPALASCANTLLPSIARSAPLFPSPASNRPSPPIPSEYTTSSRDVHNSSGAPSGAIL